MREKIQNYLIDIAKKKNVEIDEDTDLYETGILDSMEMIMLLVYIDEKLGIKISIENLKADNFNTINAIINSLNIRYK